MNTLVYWTGHISCKKQGIIYKKSYLMIDLDLYDICYLDTFITNLQLFYIRMGSTMLA